MFKNIFNPEPEDRLPNGRTRQEYYDAGISDSEIEFWGLDQPGAPGPQAAGFVIMDHDGWRRGAAFLKPSR